ncbi:hypothetical protein F5X68DRAFT_249259 [Plectosphaerella plurivora]|uniref:Glutaminase n=1 Tax=Plectosphaerella plurivora TaxID=936078 RepID=A0A9P9A5T6_9PEZI|nr:hypothetical protein F5X68DRAFT_249259 [Plectosphaerella plurivora]
MRVLPFILLAPFIASASVLTPPVLPLFVRNPYLNTWLGDARDLPWKHWPIFWTGQELGFSVMISVPESGTVYPLLGKPQDYLGGPASPITPTSTLRQSLPAAYLAVSVKGSFDVNLYVDINGMWASGSGESQIIWELAQPGTDVSQETRSKTQAKSWKLARQEQLLLSEHWERGEWGTLYFTGPAEASHQAGSAQDLRRRFAEHGSLTNQVDGRFRRIDDAEPAFAFSKAFHLTSTQTHGSASDDALFTFALAQNPVVQFASSRGLTMMRPLWSSYIESADDMVRYHYDDFAVASALAQNYSDQLALDAYASGSEYYQDIVALSARQVLGATQFSGTPDDPILFLKEISSNGNFQTVDVIFPSFPFFLYTNPKWLGYLLEPLLEHMLSGQYPNDYSMHDLGAHFPNATGHPDGEDEYMPVEECGNMIIMGLALANAFKHDTQPAFLRSVNGAARLSPHLADHVPKAHAWSLRPDAAGIDIESDTASSGTDHARSWLSRSHRLWKQWTGYLVRESLIPANQLCTDDFAGWLANQTNLALKGIIGIKAMSEVSSILDEHKDVDKYADIAEDYVAKWQGFAVSRDGTHAKLAYTWYGSWTTIYNLFADSLLCFRVPGNQTEHSVRRDRETGSTVSSNTKTEFVPSKIYKMESNWYHAVLQTYGLPLDSRHLYTKSDWEFFAAAVTSKKTRTEILKSIALWVNETTTDRPFTDLYETETGGWPGPHFKARPVVGGHFALLALGRACGGKAVEHLSFLDEPGAFEIVDVAAALEADRAESTVSLIVATEIAVTSSHAGSSYSTLDNEDALRRAINASSARAASGLSGSTEEIQRAR